MTSLQFDLWISQNPEVWRLFCHYTHQLIAAGHRHGSADAVVHRIRWHTDVDTTYNGEAGA